MLTRSLVVPFPLLLILALGLGASPALADEDEELLEGEFEDEGLNDEDALEDGEFDEEVDDEATYEAYRQEIDGEPPSEQIDAWYSYLEAYPKSLYRLEIERRIDALEEAAFEELIEEQAELDEKKDRVDAKSQEMQLADPGLLGMNPNTRRKVEVGIHGGYTDYFNYQLAFEWAFLRKLSVYGSLRHVGKGFGAGARVGVKYALVKDVRTGVVLSGAFSLDFGYSSFDLDRFAIEPWLGFGWIANDVIQLQTSLAFNVQLNRLHTYLLWDIQLVIRPTEVFGVYVGSRQKHSLLSNDDLPTTYLGFYQATVGVKIRPSPVIEVTVGANIPYGWQLWKDYSYVGVHAGLAFFFKKGPKN